MGRVLLRAALAFLAVGSCVVADPMVTIPESNVKYRGITTGSVEQFMNIRFAHDTSGARRFAPPEPYTPPEGSKIDATKPGAACPQMSAAVPPFFVETTDISEDCLNVRIARPVGTSPGDKLPVVVQIIEAGVVKGWAYDPHADPEPLVTLSASLGKPVIYVAIQSRLTIFGFARVPLLGEQKSLNVGMRDQRAGVQWIKDHIAAFGGDPERITAWGLSAAGTMTSLQLVAYGGEQGVPFTQAWVMSGPPGTALNMESGATEGHTRAVAEKLGCPHGKDEDAELLQCLRDVPMNQLVDTAMEYSLANHPPMGLFTFIPSVDGDFFPDRQSALYRAGKFATGIPMVLAWTQDDGATQAGPAQLYESEEGIKTLIQSFSVALTDEDYEKLFALYPASDFAEDLARYSARKSESDPDAPVHWFQASQIMRDLLFTCSSIDLGYEMSRHSKAANPSFDGVRLYSLNQSMLTHLFAGAGMPYVGVAHGSDMNYVLNGVFPEGEVSEQDRKLSAALAESFIQFAYTGNPEYAGGSEAGLATWPQAFPQQQNGSHDNDAHAGPSLVNVQIIAGPLGTGTYSIRGEKDGSGSNEASMEVPGMVGVEYGAMESAVAEARKQEGDRQRLLERCAFVNTLSEKLGH
ncbi:alpha/beta-hydrolase [Thozetella sp. PMI_491]|nr:alpha/beta-hydrolase [Thozetella sp. PMI_491]